MSRPRIGALRHRLSLESVTLTPDGGGGATETWSALAEMWGSITPVSGGEGVTAEAIRGSVTHTIHIRHRNDIEPAMRLRAGDRTFEITAIVDPDERRRFLACHCRERDL